MPESGSALHFAIFFSITTTGYQGILNWKMVVIDQINFPLVLINQIFFARHRQRYISYFRYVYIFPHSVSCISKRELNLFLRISFTLFKSSVEFNSFSIEVTALSLMPQGTI